MSRGHLQGKICGQNTFRYKFTNTHKLFLVCS